MKKKKIVKAHKVAKKMLKGKSGEYMQKKYGEKAEEVAYATAMKQQKESAELKDHYKTVLNEKLEESFMDTLQTIGDVAGVVDPTGIVDVANAGVSAVRGAMESDPEKKQEHYVNAGLRAVSAIPVVGDAAKAGIYGKKIANIAKGSKLIDNQALRSVASFSGTIAKNQTRQNANSEPQAASVDPETILNMARGMFTKVPAPVK
jgi:hypothetical protein